MFAFTFSQHKHRTNNEEIATCTKGRTIDHVTLHGPVNMVQTWISPGTNKNRRGIPGAPSSPINIDYIINQSLMFAFG